MKNFLVVLVLVVGFSSVAQINDSLIFNRNELKLNAILLVAGSFDVTYERLINEESGVGISAQVALTSEFDVNFAITPYYRFYFGKKPAAGFFAEGFGMLNQVDDFVYVDENDFNGESKTITDFAFGIGVGSKWITKRGVLFEINAGVGRNLFSEYNSDRDYEFIGRFGITVGYRF